MVCEIQGQLASIPRTAQKFQGYIILILPLTIFHLDTQASSNGSRLCSLTEPTGKLYFMFPWEKLYFEVSLLSLLQDHVYPPYSTTTASQTNAGEAWLLSNPLSPHMLPLGTLGSHSVPFLLLTGNCATPRQYEPTQLTLWTQTAFFCHSNMKPTDAPHLTTSAWKHFKENLK